MHNDTQNGFCSNIFKYVKNVPGTKKKQKTGFYVYATGQYSQTGRIMR